MKLLCYISLVIDECLIFWKKARIPTQDRCHCLKQLKKLYEELRNLEKCKNRNSELCRQRVHSFGDILNDLFDIAHSSALNIIKINEVKEFLILQRQKGRPGCMLGTDVKLARIEKRKHNREKKYDEILNEPCSSNYEEGILNYIYFYNLFKIIKNIFIVLFLISAEFNSTSSSNDGDELQSLTETESLTSPTPYILQTKRARLEILIPRLSAVLDKCKISDRDAVHLLISCIEATSLNPLDFVINRTSIRLSRQRFRELNASRIKLNLSDLNLKFITKHWDSKILLI